VAAIDAVTPAGRLAMPAKKAARGKPTPRPATPATKAAPAKATPRPATPATAAPARTTKKPAPARGAPAKAARAARTPPPPATLQRFVPQALELLASQKHPPARLSRLRSALLSWFQPQLAEADVDALVALLAKAGKVAIEGTKVAYRT
jgi:hypothetical protein